MGSSPRALFIEDCKSAIDQFVSVVLTHGLDYQVKNGVLISARPDTGFCFTSWVKTTIHLDPKLWDLKLTVSTTRMMNHAPVNRMLSYVLSRCRRHYTMSMLSIAELLQILYVIHDATYWPSEPTQVFLDFVTELGFQEGEIASLKRQLASAKLEIAARDLQLASVRIHLAEAKETIQSLTASS